MTVTGRAGEASAYSTMGQKIYPDRIVSLKIEKGKLPAEGIHSFFRLYIIETGSLLLRLNGKKMLVESPACLCLNNEDTVTDIECQNSALRVIYFLPHVINSRFGDSVLSDKDRQSFTFTENQDYIWLDSFIYNNKRARRYVKMGPSSLKKLNELCTRLEEQLNEQPDYFWPCRARSVFLEIIYLVHNMQYHYEGFKNFLDNEPNPIDSVLLYIHSFYNTKITLSLLVERFAVNRTKLNDLFISATGFTVIRYLIEIRMKLACLVLRDTMRPVKEIAFQTGFTDLSHFGRTFKKHINCSPQEYRAKYNWMLD